jgi:hypothetical protein
MKTRKATIQDLISYFEEDTGIVLMYGIYNVDPWKLARDMGDKSGWHVLDDQCGLVYLSELVVKIE